MKRGRLFIVDEANLVHPKFWDFLRNFFNEDPDQRYIWINGEKRYFSMNDRIIFTGNQETLAGRKFQDLIKEFVTIVDFMPFVEEFLYDRIREYIKNGRFEEYAENKGEDVPDILARDILRIHSLFNEVAGFTLRDIQEFTARINNLPLFIVRRCPFITRTPGGAKGRLPGGILYLFSMPSSALTTTS